MFVVVERGIAGWVSGGVCILVGGISGNTCLVGGVGAGNMDFSVLA